MRNFISSLALIDGGESPSSLPPDIKFLAFGDIQYTDGSPRGTPRQYMFRDSLLYAASQHSDTQFLLSVGDYGEDKVINDSPNQYDELNAIINLYTGDKYNSFGNHDSSFPSKLHLDDIEDFMDYTPFKSFDLMDTLGYGHEQRTDTGLHVILMNAMEDAYQGDAGGNDATGHFYYQQSQVDWLQGVLDSITEENARILVVTHAPWKTDTFRTGQIEREYQHEQTQADACISMLIDWQTNSNKGLVLGVLSGHTHIDGTFTSGTAPNQINHFTLDEYDEVPTGYTGDENTITTDTQYMAVSVFHWNERLKSLNITGYGQQSSYLIDMSDRIS